MERTTKEQEKIPIQDDSFDDSGSGKDDAYSSFQIQRDKGDETVEGNPLEIGLYVYARYQHSEKIYTGHIIDKTGKGRYAVAFDDGAIDSRVSSTEITPIQMDKVFDNSFATNDEIYMSFNGAEKLTRGYIEARNIDGSYLVVYEKDQEKEYLNCWPSDIYYHKDADLLSKHDLLPSFDPLTRSDLTKTLPLDVIRNVTLPILSQESQISFQAGMKVKIGDSLAVINYVNTSEKTCNVLYEDVHTETTVAFQNIRISSEEKDTRENYNNSILPLINHTEKSKSKTFKLNDHVVVNKKFGKIEKVNVDNTYSVGFINGKIEVNIPECDIQYKNESLEPIVNKPKPLFYPGGCVKVISALNGRGNVTQVYDDGTMNVQLDSGKFIKHVDAEDCFIDDECQKIDAITPEKRLELSKQKPSKPITNELYNLDIGDRVCVSYRSDDLKSNGKISSCNVDGTYNVLFDDNKEGLSIKYGKIEKINMGKEVDEKLLSSYLETESMEPTKLKLGHRVESKNPTTGLKEKATVIAEDGTDIYDILFDSGYLAYNVSIFSMQTLNDLNDDIERKFEEGRQRNLPRKPSTFQRDDSVMAVSPRYGKYCTGKIFNVDEKQKYAIVFDYGEYFEKIPYRDITIIDDYTVVRGDSFCDPSKKEDGFEEERDIRIKDRVLARKPTERAFFLADVEQIDQTKNLFSLKFEKETKLVQVERDHIITLCESVPIIEKKENTETHRFQTNDLCSAKFVESAEYYEGKIRRVNPDGSYDIKYDDGDRDPCVHPNDVIQYLKKEKKRKKDQRTLSSKEVVKQKDDQEKEKVASKKYDLKEKERISSRKINETKEIIELKVTKPRNETRKHKENTIRGTIKNIRESIGKIVTISKPEKKP